MQFDPRTFPAVWANAANTVLAVILSFGLLDQVQTHWVLTGSTALAGLVCCFLVRPVDVAAAGGLFSTVLVAVGPLGLAKLFHVPSLNDEMIGALTALFTMLAGYLVHLTGTPARLWKQGTTVQAEHEAMHRVAVR